MLMNIAPAALLTWVGILANLVAVIIGLVNGMGILSVSLSVGQSLLNLCLTVFLLGLITTISEWKQINCKPYRKLCFVFTFPLFMLTYLPISAAALVCKPGWKPIAHNRNISIREFQCESTEERSA